MLEEQAQERPRVVDGAFRVSRRANVSFHSSRTLGSRSKTYQRGMSVPTL